MRANITSPLHISNLISHMHNRKFPVARTRAHRQSSSLRGGISFQFLSHRTTVELFLTPLPLPLELILSTTMARNWRYSGGGSLQCIRHCATHRSYIILIPMYTHAHTKEHVGINFGQVGCRFLWTLYLYIIYMSVCICIHFLIYIYYIVHRVSMINVKHCVDV